MNMGKFIILENIQDPTNLGTILRTAEALGINFVIMSKDCCDIYNSKTLRGSMGAVFRVIGNEGNGLSKEIINLCNDKVTIPMLGRAESLNAAMAAGILMWEMMRGSGESVSYTHLRAHETICNLVCRILL